jgi:hypothetical protein
MGIFQFNINNKTFIIFITAIIWAINFRTTFKNIDSHMDSGSYSSLKYDPQLLFFKNIASCLFFLGFFLESKIISSQKIIEKELIHKKEGNFLIVQYEEKKNARDSLFSSLLIINGLNDIKSKIFFWIKIIIIIIIIYSIEELYFIIDNNHILDRLVCPIRNLGILISLLIFSSLLIKKKCTLYSHQLIPLLIIFILSIGIIMFNVLIVDRFKKIYGFNFIIYLSSFILMGFEMVLISLYKIEEKIIGTLFFGIINIIKSKKQFFDFFDKLLSFEYDDMYMEFDIYLKIMYVISLLLLQYLKIFTINIFTENHLLSVLMLTDIIYFPLYIIERFVIQGLTISTLSTFIINTSLGFINLFLILMFIEILECKFLELDKDLIENINERQKQDALISLSQSRPSLASSVDNKEEEEGNELENH